jgi:hypothetical protein
MVPNVSHPGGARAHKIQRVPQFPDIGTQLDMADSNVWRCVVAEESHEDTEHKFSGIASAVLTGESCGRQIWTTQVTKRAKGKKVNEKLVQELATGGRVPRTFNPGQNPNRYVFLCVLLNVFPINLYLDSGHWTLLASLLFESLRRDSCDLIFRAQQIRNYMAGGGKPPDLKTRPKTAKEAAKKAAHFYSMLQTDDGHWAGDYGGPHFLMPGLIIAWYVMGQPTSMLNEQQTKLMKHYISAHQQIDGGWGTDLESPSTMFGTTLMYVALRLLGVDMEDPRCQKGRAFILKEGGAIMTASWAKFYLCLLGCMEWDGHNSVPAEFWFLPNWFPFHPGRLWCHCRMVYLPMGYLYGSRFVYEKAASDPVVQSLRKELYVQDYDSINWIKTRHMVADMDNYSPLSSLHESSAEYFSEV